MSSGRRAEGNGAVVAIVVVIGIVLLLGVIVVVGGLGALMLFGVRSPGPPNFQPPSYQVAPTTSVSPPPTTTQPQSAEVGLAPVPMLVAPETPAGPAAALVMIDDDGTLYLQSASVTKDELKAKLALLRMADENLRVELIVRGNAPDSEALQKVVTNVFKEMNLPYTVRD